MAGLVGIAALARVLARRRGRHELPATRLPQRETDPADELRRKLSETRETPTVDAPTERPDSSQATPAEPQETLDERRSRVHAKAQEAIDAMQDRTP